jgi:hypothetical protein
MDWPHPWRHKLRRPTAFQRPSVPSVANTSYIIPLSYPTIQSSDALAKRLLLISCLILVLSLSFTLAPVIRLFALLGQFTPVARTAFIRSRSLSTNVMGYPTPPPAPQFTHTAKEIRSVAERIIEKSRKVQDDIVKDITPEKATFDNVILPMALDENLMVSFN